MLAEIVNKALTSIMQRTLPLPAPGARHPFRQAVAAQRIARTRVRDEEDVKLFVLSFSAFFVCFYTFIF
jgi:hypothetical protein